MKTQLAFPWTEETRSVPESVEIHSRRYLGSKSRLLPFLHRIVTQECGPYESFADLFAGTGVVAHSFNRPHVRIVANDYLLSNAVSLSCWLKLAEWEEAEASSLLGYLNSLPDTDENYISEQFGERYFSRDNARKIGAVRDEIDRLPLSPALRAVALTSLLYAADRVARTCGHYDAYRRRPDAVEGPEERDRPLRLPLPRIEIDSNSGNEIYRDDANALVRDIETDILYLDPPYNSRQYSDTYHVLETLIRNDKSELIGVARKRPGRPQRSKYCGKDAVLALEDLILHANCRWILFSYNNMTDGDKRSNAILTETQIREVLSRRGEVQIHRTSFNSFTAKRELIAGHEEWVYLCRVETPPAVDGSERPERVQPSILEFLRGEGGTGR